MWNPLGQARVSRPCRSAAGPAPRSSLAILATTLGACSTVAPVLKDREFLSVRVTEGGAPKALVAGTRIALRFSEADVGASAGCNGLGGTYRIDLGKLLYERGGQTAKGCEPLLQAQDEWLVDFLDSDPTITLIGNDLTLDSGATSIHLRDREVAEPDLNIVGPTWTVETIIAGDAVVERPGGRDRDHRLQGGRLVRARRGLQSRRRHLEARRRRDRDLRRDAHQDGVRRRGRPARGRGPHRDRRGLRPGLHRSRTC